ncbi:MAG TPA: hypothetical protein VLC11_00980, partial [Gemmatimonadales bacterium]|nr:hypothetical protein [Gemmatimonadales bacterium]
MTGPIRVLTIGTGLVDAGFGWHADTTIFTGSSAVFPDSLSGSVHLQGADTLTHSFTALGQLAVDGAGALTVNGHVLVADSSLTIASSGLLRMTNAADSVDVHGGFSVSSITASSGAMTAGTLVLRGGFAQVSGSGLNFAASGSHRTVFAGTAAQAASFQSPGLSSSHFQDVTFDNAAGVTLSSPMASAGSATILAGNVTGATSNVATIAGNLVDASNSRWHVDTTYFTGSPVLPDSFSGSVHFQGATTLAKALKVLGAVAVDGGGVFTLGGHPFTVTGTFSLAGSGQLVMSNAADSMDVGGPFTVSSITSSGTGLSAGVLVLRGNFSQVAGSGLNFSATGSHQTILAGAAAQSVAFQNPALTSSHFQDVTFANAAGITLGSNVAVSGTATVSLGQVSGTARTGTIAGGLVDAGYGWRADTTVFTGHPALPDSVFGNVHIQGADTLAKAFRATGTLAVDQSGMLVVNGHPLSVAGAMTVANSGRFVMTNPADSVNVGGAYTAGGASSTGDLTAGKLVLRGNFAQLANASGDFAPSGTHLTVFAGTAAQSVAFANPGAAQSHFQDVTFDNAAGVALTSNAVAVGTATALAGNVTGVAKAATIGTALVDASNTRWQVDTTVFSGTPVSLPDSIHSNVHFQGALTLAKALRIVGGAYVDGGTGTLTVGGSITVTAATGAVSVLGGGASDDYAQIGHGGFEAASGLHAGGVYVGGNISVTGQTVLVSGGT